jgi:hypothetical protein
MDPNRERLRDLKPESPLYDFRCFVESMVEEIILEDKPFDSYKDELKKRCEKVGVDYSDLECDLEDLLEKLDMGIKSPDCLAIGMAMAFVFEDAAKCYVREEKIEEICETWNARHPNHEFHPHNPIPNM